MTQHPAFLTRPNYRQPLTLLQLRTRARQQRMAGYYNISTLWLFRACWQQSGMLTDYINYLAFRRDLGYPLSAKQRQRLVNWPHALITRCCWPLLNRHANRIKNRLLRQTNPEQLQLAEQFQHYLAQYASIQIVGNSATLQNQQQGQNIDQAPLVLRFNRCFSEHTDVKDIGQKTDIWVCAPDFKHQATSAKWCILAGPDMLGWLSTAPKVIEGQPGVLSIPLAPWRLLVRTLAAPPSAGILVLEWLSAISPGCRRYVTGFSYPKNTEQYHLADPHHNAVTRHNWLQEMQLLRHWQRLNIITAGTKEKAN